MDNRLLNKDFWSGALARGLPGVEAQLGMAPEVRGLETKGEAYSRAAVMALLYPSGTSRSMAFIKRNVYPGAHSGQISFPGGAWEETDPDLEATALRETREELGIEHGIEVLGALTPLHVPVSNFMVYPFLGWMEGQAIFHPDQTEVQYVIEVPLEHLLDPDNRLNMEMRHGTMNFKAPYFKVDQEQIWGATAMMLNEVLQLTAG